MGEIKEIKALSDLLKIDAGQWKAHDEEIAKLEEKQAQPGAPHQQRAGAFGH